VIDAKPARRRPRIKTVLREWDRQRLGEISREDLEAIVGRLADQLADRDAEISALNDDLAERDREIARLKNELDWETAERRQLESLYRPAPND
jgi:uncharacterized coiled-coil protein SlyX